MRRVVDRLTLSVLRAYSGCLGMKKGRVFQPVAASEASERTFSRPDDGPILVSGGVAPGAIDFFGYAMGAGGWLFLGWVTRPFRAATSGSFEMVIRTAKGQARAQATVVFYERKDLDPSRVGVIAFVEGSRRAMNGLTHLAVSLEGVLYGADITHTTERPTDPDLSERVRRVLVEYATDSPNRKHLLSLTSRRGFSGEDTLGSLEDAVLMEIDATIPCADVGVLLKGWILSVPDAVHAIRLHSGPKVTVLHLEDAVKIPRADVLTAVGRAHGFSDPRCGFAIFVPNAISTGDTTYLEVELKNGEVGFREVRLSSSVGLDAIRRLLDGIDHRYEDIDLAFDRVFGPAVSAINDARRALRPATQEMTYGEALAQPAVSVIVPLYGRIDFLEYQMAIFSKDAMGETADLIYVLDDPCLIRDLRALADSVYERFQIPFRIILNGANLGYAPANNIGLAAARAPLVCFLNSDVLPISERWLERLADTLKANPKLGVVGPRLLFEDGSIQHEGLVYRPIPEFAGWTFIDHDNKGRRPESSVAVRMAPAITGACMLMRRALAVELGGFDESYVIGDFEDSDLCQKLAARGLLSAVDCAIEAHHLERQSQSMDASLLRMNITLYNAWIHQRRWFSKPRAVSARRASV